MDCVTIVTSAMGTPMACIAFRAMRSNVRTRCVDTWSVPAWAGENTNGTAYQISRRGALSPGRPACSTTGRQPSLGEPTRASHSGGPTGDYLARLAAPSASSRCLGTAPGRPATPCGSRWTAQGVKAGESRRATSAASTPHHTCNPTCWTSVRAGRSHLVPRRVRRGMVQQQHRRPRVLLTDQLKGAVRVHLHQGQPRCLPQ